MEIISSSFLQSIYSGCTKAGINYKKYVLNTDLKYFDYECTSLYVPMFAANDFLNQLSRHQGITDISQEFSSHIKLSSLINFGEIVTNSNSLLDACLIAEKMSSSILSNGILKLKISGNKAVFYQIFSRCNPDDYATLVKVHFTYLINTFEFITSQAWQPTEIHYQASQLPEVLLNAPAFRNAKIFLNQAYTCIVFDVNELAHPFNKTNNQALNINALNIGNLSHRIELLIDSYTIGCKSPSIESVAQFLQLSERTLRRRLTTEGTTFAKILSSWRIRKSIDYLKNSDYSVNEISYNLHYSCDSNFIRAFKRTFSISPETFRES